MRRLATALSCAALLWCAACGDDDYGMERPPRDGGADLAAPDAQTAATDAGADAARADATAADATTADATAADATAADALSDAADGGG